LTINGNCNGGASGWANFGIYHNSTGKLVVNGAVTAGASGASYGIYNYGNGPVTVVGAVTAVAGPYSTGLYNRGSGILNITGVITGGSGSEAHGVFNSAGAAVLIGNLINGTGGVAWSGKPPVWDIATNPNGYLSWCRASALSTTNVKHGPVPNDHELLYPVVCGDVTGSLIVPGAASGSATLAKEAGAKARGGSGTCAKLTPTSASAYGYWDFYVPATASTPFTLSFYWAKSAAGFNGLLKVSIWDTDGTTLKNTSEAVNITAADANYHQFSATPVTPTDTGLCRVRLEIEDGSTTGFLYIDDIAVA
jgi:hypothetical protein